VITAASKAVRPAALDAQAGRQLERYPVAF